jgi:hypothetical protein
MHIVIYEYPDGSRYVFETDEYGNHLKDLEGRRLPGSRIRAVLDMLCDDNEEGRSTLLAAVKRGEQLVSERAA